MTNERVICSKQFISIIEKQLLKAELGIQGIYGNFSIKKKNVLIYRFKDMIYVNINEKLFIQEEIQKIWHNNIKTPRQSV